MRRDSTHRRDARASASSSRRTTDDHRRSRGRLRRSPFASLPLTKGEEASMLKPQMLPPRLLLAAFAAAGLLGCDGLTSPSHSHGFFSVSAAKRRRRELNRAMFATADAPSWSIRRDTLRIDSVRRARPGHPAAGPTPLQTTGYNDAADPTCGPQHRSIRVSFR